MYIVWNLVFGICLFILCLPHPAHAAKSDYEALVQRNLELREKLDTLEQQYVQIENERNVLISHVRNLQLERENLAQAQKEVEDGRSRYSEFQKATEQANEKLGSMTKERDQLREELAGMKEPGNEDQPAVKALESEKNSLSKRLEELNGTISKVTKEKDELQKELADVKKTLEASRSAAKILGTEKDALTHQIETVQEKLEKSQSAQKDLAIERAFLRAQESELFARNRAVLAESDQLKADVQRLTKVNEALKDAEQKWHQAKRDLDASRAGSRRVEVKNKKLENKLARMNVLKKRSGKKEEELQALRMLQKEHESMIGKLTAEKSALEAQLAKFKVPTGIASVTYVRQKGALSPVNKQRLDMHFNLAVAYDKTKMYKAEEREYMECLRIDPNDANVHYNLGILYDDQLNDNAKAIRHYQTYLRLRPMNEDTALVKEWIIHAEQQGRL